MSAVGRSIPLISPCACHGCRAHLLPCADRPLHLCALLAVSSRSTRSWQGVQKADAAESRLSAGGGGEREEGREPASIRGIYNPDLDPFVRSSFRSPLPHIRHCFPTMRGRSELRDKFSPRERILRLPLRPMGPPSHTPPATNKQCPSTRPYPVLRSSPSPLLLPTPPAHPHSLPWHQFLAVRRSQRLLAPSYPRRWPSLSYLFLPASRHSPKAQSICSHPAP